MNNGYKECTAEHACSTSDAKAIACSGAVKEMASLKKPMSFDVNQHQRAMQFKSGDQVIYGVFGTKGDFVSYAKSSINHCWIDIGLTDTLLVPLMHVSHAPADHVDALSVWKVDCQYIPKETICADTDERYVAYGDGF